ncbi:coronin-6-like isoform X2 [Tubulanus polymorphus]|uniref:coronin-6-like isoform X2 n=1 Tax=Tubulanus polymorphus TaxID=672921 RepID=UPI003DA2BE88
MNNQEMSALIQSRLRALGNTEPTNRRRMAFKMRSSKYRHVFGDVAKKEHCYENVKITKNQHDAHFCAVNPKFMAVVTESAGGGAFLVLPISKKGRVDINAPKVCGHAGPVMDIKWNPFDDHQIASCSEDATIKVWQIPDDGLIENLTEWIVDLHGHQRRIGYIEWHPTAEHILISAGFDFNVILWNLETAEPINIISCHNDTIYSMSWNRDGSLLATTCKDKRIRVIDPRSGNIVAEGQGHVGTKASKVVFLGDTGRLFTTGFSKMSDRQFGIWDINNLSSPLRVESIDASSGVLLPYYDHDTGVVFLAGKGDGNIRYYEIVPEKPYCHFLDAFMSGNPQRGLGSMPKRGVDVAKCEIMRFYKLHSSKTQIDIISMKVPRKSETFQEDIFPPTSGKTPSLTAQEWIHGHNRDPILISLKDGAQAPVNTPMITTYKAIKRNEVVSPIRQQSPEPVQQQQQQQTRDRPAPASVRNIRLLSLSDDQVPNLNDLNEGKITTEQLEQERKIKDENISVNQRISFLENLEENTNQPHHQMTRETSIEKKTGGKWVSEIPVNGIPKTDSESKPRAPPNYEARSVEIVAQSPKSSKRSALDSPKKSTAKISPKVSPRPAASAAGKQTISQVPARSLNESPSNRRRPFAGGSSGGSYHDNSVAKPDHTSSPHQYRRRMDNITSTAAAAGVAAAAEQERSSQAAEAEDVVDNPDDIDPVDIAKVRAKSVKELVNRVDDHGSFATLRKGTKPLESSSSTEKYHVKKVWSQRSSLSHENGDSHNGPVPNTDQELRKAYFRQLEEMRCLREQVSLKDKRIHQLEDEIKILKGEHVDSRYESNC